MLNLNSPAKQVHTATTPDMPQEAQYLHNVYEKIPSKIELVFNLFLK